MLRFFYSIPSIMTRTDKPGNACTSAVVKVTVESTHGSVFGKGIEEETELILLQHEVHMLLYFHACSDIPL